MYLITKSLRKKTLFLMMGRRAWFANVRRTATGRNTCQSFT